MRNTAVNLHDVIEMMGPCNGGGGRCGGGEAEINCGFSRADVSGEYRCDDARTSHSCEQFIHWGMEYRLFEYSISNKTQRLRVVFRGILKLIREIKKSDII